MDALNQYNVLVKASHEYVLRFKPNNKSTEYWTPCSPGDKAGKEMSWKDIVADQLMEPVVNMVNCVCSSPIHWPFQADMLKALGNTKPTVNEKDLKKLQQFTDEFGQEGM